MKAMAFSENISVVLVDTHSSGNIGATARAIKNMGLKRLKLVNPSNPFSLESRTIASKAIDILESAQVYASLNEALAEENIVVGTTSTRRRRGRQPIYTPQEISLKIREYAQDRRVACLFGPERRGLSESQLSRCQYVVSIPADPNFPVLNLSHSIIIFCYEIFRAALVDSKPVPELASDLERHAMYSHIEQVLVEIGFLSSESPEHIMQAIRRFLGRAELAPRDVQIIRGVMSQMEWYVQQGQKLQPDQIIKP